jgi:siderophore synthetase component
VRRVEAFLSAPAPEEPCRDGFLDAEQALLLGHLHHPAPKNRDGITPAEAAAWSPELRGSFRLHWFAADPTVVSQDAVTDSPALRGRDTAGLFADLAELSDAQGRILVPAHPWQARDAVRRPRVAALVDAGLLEPLGERGTPWYPTSSVRTLYRPGTEVMLKLSLGLRITNSRRELTRKELRHGVEMHRLLDLGYLAATTARHPSFSIVRDPGWLAVDEPQRADGPKLNGLDVAVREVPEEAYSLAVSRLPELLRARGATETALAVVDDRIIEDRLCYYLLRNQVLAVVGCLALDGLADEPELVNAVVGRLHAALPELAAAGPDGDRLTRRWLTEPTLPCKGNLFTRLHGIDVVRAPLDAQSVYLEAPNPLLPQ